MRKAMFSKHEWHYSTAYGLAGLVTAAMILVLMRHDMAQALTLAAAVASGAGWTCRPLRAAIQDDRRSGVS